MNLFSLVTMSIFAAWSLIGARCMCKPIVGVARKKIKCTLQFFATGSSNEFIFFGHNVNLGCVEPYRGIGARMCKLL